MQLDVTASFHVNEKIFPAEITEIILDFAINSQPRPSYPSVIGVVCKQWDTILNRLKLAWLERRLVSAKKSEEQLRNDITFFTNGYRDDGLYELHESRMFSCIAVKNDQSGLIQKLSELIKKFKDEQFPLKRQADEEEPRLSKRCKTIP